MDGCQGFELRLAHSQTENKGLLTDTLLKPQCLRVRRWECGPCTAFAIYTLAFTLQLRKITEKPQSRYNP